MRRMEGIKQLLIFTLVCCLAFLPVRLKIESANSGENEETEMTENSLALFKDAPNPHDAINGALALLTLLRDNFSVEDEHYPVWLQIGIVADTVAAAAERLKGLSHE